MKSYNKVNFEPSINRTGRDFVAPGVQNVWICEVGSETLNGSFADFSENLLASKVFFFCCPFSKYMLKIAFF
jgi:hypothetical protein